MTFIKIPGVFPPTNRPRIDLVDGLLPNQGAMFLIEPAHPYLSWGSGVPAAGSTLPNVVFEQAESVLSTSNVSATFKTSVPADLTIERTAKGGLHVIPKLNVSTNRYAQVMLEGPAWSQYVYDNWQHDFYFSMWTSVTRQHVGTGTPPFVGAIAEGSIGYLADHYLSNSTYPNSGADHIGSLIGTSSGQSMTVGVPQHRYVGVSSYQRSVSLDGGAAKYQPYQPSGATVVKFQAFGAGRLQTPVANSFTDPGAVVLYRSYLEDLTVSGRTYTEVQAIDAEMYNREVKTVGGRYYGDTYTAPPTA